MFVLQLPCGEDQLIESSTIILYSLQKLLLHVFKFITKQLDFQIWYINTCCKFWNSELLNKCTARLPQQNSYTLELAELGHVIFELLHQNQCTYF